MSHCGIIEISFLEVEFLSFALLVLEQARIQLDFARGHIRALQVFRRLRVISPSPAKKGDLAIRENAWSKFSYTEFCPALCFPGVKPGTDLERFRRTKL